MNQFKDEDIEQIAKAQTLLKINIKQLKTKQNLELQTKYRQNARYQYQDHLFIAIQ